MILLRTMASLGLAALGLGLAWADSELACRKPCADVRQSCRKEALAYDLVLPGRSGDHLRHPEDRYDASGDLARQRRELIERCESAHQRCLADCRPPAARDFPTGEVR